MGNVIIAINLRMNFPIVSRPVRPGPLVERGGACGAVLAAQAGRTRHVVVGHHRRLHRLQGLIGSVASGGDTVSTQSHHKQERTQKTHEDLLPSSAPAFQPFLPQGAAACHGWAGGLLRGRVGPGNGPSSSCRVVAMLLERQSPVKTRIVFHSVAAAFLLSVNAFVIMITKLTNSGSRERSGAYLGLKPLSASGRKRERQKTGHALWLVV